MPKEGFHLVIDFITDKKTVLSRIAKIGYEKQIKSVITLGADTFKTFESLDLQIFKNNPTEYTIIDIRNKSEVAEGRFFENAISIPLNELRNSEEEIPTNKPIVVHCAGGYRSAAGSSIISKLIDSVPVYDLSDDVNDFK